MSDPISSYRATCRNADLLLGADVLAVLKAAGVTPGMVSPEETKLGGIETHAEARRCAELFRRHRDQIDGVLVVLPNFGDEKGVADTLKLSGLNVPTLPLGPGPSAMSAT